MKSAILTTKSHGTATQSHTTPQASVEQAEQAVKQFSRLAMQLQQSQLKLQDELSSLENELIEVDQQRLQELAEKEALADRLQGIVSAMPSGVISLDSSGQVILANCAAKTLLGHTLEGSYWRDIIADVFRPKADDGHEISLKNGKRVSLATQGSQGNLGQIIIVTDLTETRRLQNETAQQNRLMLLGKMAAILAHQIRTPLATAQLYLTELPKHQQNTDSLQRNVEKIADKLKLLNQQVEDMLVFASKDCQLTDTIGLNKLLLDAIDSVKAKAQQHQVNIIQDLQLPNFPIQCHYTAFLGALMNLLVNAVEASDANQSVLIKSYSDADSHQYCIEVIDQGIGFDTADLKDITEPFVSNKSRGTGLGMNVVQWVMDSHHCKMTVVSQPKKGTQIIIVLGAQMIPPHHEIKDNEVRSTLCQ